MARRKANEHWNLYPKGPRRRKLVLYHVDSQAARSRARTNSTSRRCRGEPGGLCRTVPRMNDPTQQGMSPGRYPENNKAPRPCGPGAKFGGGRSPRALSQRHTVGRLAFAGRVLPDATLRGMRMSRSHGGTVPTVSGWNLSSEVSSPSSVTSCRKPLAGRGADTPANPNLSRRHPCHGDGSGFWLDVGPALRV